MLLGNHLEFALALLKINLRGKKVRAKVKPILKSNVNPNSAPIEIQKNCLSKFKPCASSVSLPTVVFDGSIWTQGWQATIKKKRISSQKTLNTIWENDTQIHTCTLYSGLYVSEYHEIFQGTNYKQLVKFIEFIVHNMDSYQHLGVTCIFCTTQHWSFLIY